MLKMLLAPQKYRRFQSVASFYFLIDFDPMMHENEWSFVTGSNSTPNYHELKILPMFDNGPTAGDRSRPVSVILMIVRLFDGEQLLSVKMNALPVERCLSTKKSIESFESYALVITGEKLNFLQLVRHQMEMLFGYSPNGSVSDSNIMDDFSHRDPRITPKPLSTSFWLLSILTVRFLMLPGQRPSWPSSLYRLIVRETVAGSIPRLQEISHLRFFRLRCAKIWECWLGI